MEMFPQMRYCFSLLLTILSRLRTPAKSNNLDLNALCQIFEWNESYSSEKSLAGYVLRV